MWHLLPQRCTDDRSVYKRVFYSYFDVKMRECVSLGDEGAFWLDFIIPLNHTVYGLEKFLYLNQSFFVVKRPGSVNIYHN